MLIVAVEAEMWAKANASDSLAWAELFIVTAMIVSNFDLTLYETTSVEIDMAHDHGVPGVKGKNGVRVTVQRME